MEKSDKRSIILASIFLVILLACLGFVVYIKMTYDLKDNNNVNNNAVDNQNMLSLDNIISQFNNSDLVNNYKKDFDLTVYMVKSGNGFSIKYEKTDLSEQIEGTFNNNVISIMTSGLNSKIRDDIFTELVNIVCKYQGHDNGECDTIVKDFLDGEDVEGLSVNTVSDDEVYFNIDISKKIQLVIENIDSYVFKGKEEVGYEIEFDSLKLVDPKPVFDSENNIYSFNATIKRPLEIDSSNLEIIVNVFDENKNIINVNNYDSTSFSIEGTEDTNFAYQLDLNDQNVSYDDIAYIGIYIGLKENNE